ncbi:MAG: carboxypeptidase-like regulatory domain-containing protein [Crocinitomicaceae bacterium]
MKRIVFTAVLFMTLTNCGNKSLFYKGYVYSDGKPLDQVTVSKMNGTQDHSTQTDSKGYFELTKEQDVVHSLIFEKEGFVTDTVPTVWSQHGEKLNYRFVNKNSDTLFIEKR